MQFSSFTRTITGNTILFKNIDPLENVQSIQSYSDNSSGSFLKKEIRWSFNGSYWSSWQTLTQNTISRIANSNRYLFLEVRYVGTGTITSLSINYIGDAYIIPSTSISVVVPSVDAPIVVTPTTGLHSFSAFTKTTTGDTILFKNLNSIENVESIKSYYDNSSGSFKKEIRWSFTGSYWSAWQLLSQNVITEINNSSHQYLFLEIRYVGSGTVTTLSINYIGAVYVPPQLA